MLQLKIWLHGQFMFHPRQKPCIYQLLRLILDSGKLVKIHIK